MDEDTKICITRISKAGRNLNARVPDDFRSSINYGDKVRIIVIEKAINNPDKVIKELKAFMENPKPEKLKGTLMGYPITIDAAELIKNLPKKALEQIFLKSLIK